jgi:hypothetical protein
VAAVSIRRDLAGSSQSRFTADRGAATNAAGHPERVTAAVISVKGFDLKTPLVRSCGRIMN